MASQPLSGANLVTLMVCLEAAATQIATIARHLQAWGDSDEDAAFYAWLAYLLEASTTIRAFARWCRRWAQAYDDLQTLFSETPEDP